MPLWSGAQTKEFSLKEIWGSPTFRPSFVMGGMSMNDGLHYTELEQVEEGLVLNQYAYATGEKVKTLFQSWDYALPDTKPLVFGEYTFSADEKCCSSPPLRNPSTGIRRAAILW